MDHTMNPHDDMTTTINGIEYETTRDGHELRNPTPTKRAAVVRGDATITIELTRHHGRVRITNPGVWSKTFTIETLNALIYEMQRVSAAFDNDTDDAPPHTRLAWERAAAHGPRFDNDAQTR